MQQYQYQFSDRIACRGQVAQSGAALDALYYAGGQQGKLNLGSEQNRTAPEHQHSHRVNAS